jgi:GT2 family glycosyltransferase
MPALLSKLRHHLDAYVFTHILLVDRLVQHAANRIRNYSAVTTACLMIRRTLFEEMGGLDEKNLAVAFSDVDLCLRLRREGYLIVYTPYALLYHKESASRGHRVDPEEDSYMMTKWRNEILSDPYYSPN